MVKLLKICFMICVLFFSSIGEDKAFAEDIEKTTYAKALEGCVLYKTEEMNNSLDEILFIVPETYFVTILEVIDEENCYMVQYDKYVGYVSPSTVMLATFTPIVKTLENITFDIKSSSGTQIWSSPSTKSSVYTTLSAGTQNISYVASVIGSVPSGGESNVWYYVYYTSSVNSTNVYEGYVYSENATNLSEIVANTETNPEVISEEVVDEKIIYISSTIKTIIVAVIAIPIILFLCIILYKIVKNIKKTTKYNNNLTQPQGENLPVLAENKNSNLINKFKNMMRVKRGASSQNFVDLQDDELL